MDIITLRELASRCPCINTDWTLSPYGYGERYVKGSHGDGKSRVERAHVYALEHKLGRPILDGMQANHHCDNRACIQPEHLYEGTQADNVRDMWDRKRGWSPFAHGVNGNPPRFAEEQKVAIRDKYATGNITMSELAEEYKCCKATISVIWREAPLPMTHRRTRWGSTQAQT